MFCARLVNVESGYGEEDENVESLHADRRTDGRRTTDNKKKTHLSFQLVIL